MPLSAERFFTVSGVAFTGDECRIHDVVVEPDDTVRVWDPIARYFTTNHILPEAKQALARRCANHEWQPADWFD